MAGCALCDRGYQVINHGCQIVNARLVGAGGKHPSNITLLSGDADDWTHVVRVVGPRVHALHIIKWVRGAQLAAVEELPRIRGDDPAVGHRDEGTGGGLWGQRLHLAGFECIPGRVEQLAECSGWQFPRKVVCADLVRKCNAVELFAILQEPPKHT